LQRHLQKNATQNNIAEIKQYVNAVINAILLYNINGSMIIMVPLSNLISKMLLNPWAGQQGKKMLSVNVIPEVKLSLTF